MKRFGLLLILCVSSSLLAQQPFKNETLHPDGPVELMTDEVVARFPFPHPSVRVYPTDPRTGQVSEEHYGGMVPLFHREMGDCRCCKQSQLPGDYLSCNVDPGATTDYVDLKQIHWDRDLVEEPETGQLQQVTFRTNQLGSPGSITTLLWEAIRAPENRSMSNGQTERVLALRPNTIKFSLEISNYTSQMHGPNADNLWAHALTLAVFLSEETTCCSILFGAFNLGLERPSQWQQVYYLQSKNNANFQLHLTQCLFSMADPPSLSRETAENETQQGFELMDFMMASQYQENGVVKGQIVELFFPGGTDTFYDPELGMLLQIADPEADGEDGEDENDKVWIPTVATLLGALSVFGAIAGVLSFWWWQRRRAALGVNGARHVNF